MSIVASLIKITALALALLCVDIRPMNAPIEMGSDSKSRHSKCRLYFGCIPSAHPAASANNDKRISR